MKKLFISLLGIVLCFALVACSSEPQSSSSTESNTTESQTSETSLSESVNSSESDSSEVQDLSDYQSILDEYTLKLQEATPTLIE